MVIYTTTQTHSLGMKAGLFKFVLLRYMQRIDIHLKAKHYGLP